MSVIITINDTLSKTTFFELQRRRRQYGSNFNHCVIIGPKCQFQSNIAKQRPLWHSSHRF